MNGVQPLDHTHACISPRGLYMVHTASNTADDRSVTGAQQPGQHHGAAQARRRELRLLRHASSDTGRVAVRGSAQLL